MRPKQRHSRELKDDDFPTDNQTIKACLAWMCLLKYCGVISDTFNLAFLPIKCNHHSTQFGVTKLVQSQIFPYPSCSRRWLRGQKVSSRFTSQRNINFNKTPFLVLMVGSIDTDNSLVRNFGLCSQCHSTIPSFHRRGQ